MATKTRITATTQGEVFAQFRNMAEERHETFVDLLINLGLLTRDDLRLQNDVDMIRFTARTEPKEAARIFKKSTHARMLCMRYLPELFARLTKYRSTARAAA